MKKAKGLAWNPEASPAENARRVLPELFRRFINSGDEATLPDASEECLHEFRLDVKRFRYTLESFQPVYGPAIKSRIEEVRQLQRVLGQMNDCRTALELIASIEPSPDDETHGWVEKIKQRMAEKRARFIDVWSTGFGLPGRQRRFVRYLTQFAADR